MRYLNIIIGFLSAPHYSILLPLCKNIVTTAVGLLVVHVSAFMSSTGYSSTGLRDLCTSVSDLGCVVECVRGARWRSG
jgi:hypothetical protein